jgi:PAS domain S-box-containing protein
MTMNRETHHIGSSENLPSHDELFQKYEELQKCNDELTLQVSVFNHAEQITQSGTWTWIPEIDKAEYSDNMFRIFGMEPGEVIPGFDTIPQFVHPEDRPKLLEGAATMKELNQVRTGEFRIIRKDGEMRYCRNVTKYIRTPDGQTMYIGTMQDITEQKKLEQELLRSSEELKALNKSLVKKNKELRQKNNDIASFSYAAGHFLKEPLRKIYTFIELLLMKEQDSISDTGKDHFKRVQSAAQRLSLLTDDIMTFSTLNATTERLTDVDLDETLAIVKNEMKSQLTAAEAIIDAAGLPTIKGYSGPLQTLFKHMLGNAIKFQHGNKPHIHIHCTSVSGKNIKHPDALADAEYVQLSFTDNGIGFSPEYAGQIFKMFHRLNDSDKYPGTGIGLTLCLKVTQLHNGFIIAESTPGNGATFHCFLQLHLKA